MARIKQVLVSGVTRLGIAMLWLLHFLPLPVLSALGNGVGAVLYCLLTRRRNIANKNLEMCFPEVSAQERKSWVKKHFRAYVRAALEHGILFWGSKKRIQAMVQVKGMEHFIAMQGRPVILFAPHFVGLDAGGLRITTEYAGTSMYARQTNPHLDKLLRYGRERFGNTKLVLRTDGLRPLIRNIKAGLPAYFLPDMDLGREGAYFIPFFGIPAATIPSLSRLVKLTSAVIIPCITWQEAHGQYRLEFFPPWEDWTGKDPLVETQKMHRFLEEQIRKAPWQYLWTHQRFKTRPVGDSSFYK
ncbi:MAG: lysophospholipid acyltransferase family protein [Pseudomonadota bacterium]